LKEEKEKRKREKGNRYQEFSNKELEILN